MEEQGSHELHKKTEVCYVFLCQYMYGTDPLYTRRKSFMEFIWGTYYGFRLRNGYSKSA
jgi:hypothetical protein